MLKNNFGFAQILPVLVLAILVGFSIFVIGQKTNLFNFASSTKVLGTTTFKPDLSWQRSPERTDAIIRELSVGTMVPAALGLALDPSQTVFDNGGVFTPQQNKDHVPVGVTWASWRQYSWGGNPTQCGPELELRHFQTTFNIAPGQLGTTGNVILRSLYYPGDILPINDNVYIYLNNNFVGRRGTSYGATNLGFGGSAVYANETDGWVGDGHLESQAFSFLRTGVNVLDLVAGETCQWGGMDKLELVIENNGPASLAVPYFSQSDPLWGSREYDHANSIGPFSCGSTLASCGCAVTSAVMLLKYYGVDKAPNGSPTTPASLNDWLKDNDGYSFGDLRWASVGSFAFNSNKIYGTPEIKFTGPSNTTDYNILNNELSNGRPVILKEPGHYVIAKGIEGTTYDINDPAYPAKNLLTSYSNSFEGMRLFELTHTDLSTIYLTTPDPAQLFLVDSLGRRVGKNSTTGIVYNEIPNSFYFVEPNLANDVSGAAPTSGGVTTLVIVNPSVGSYGVTTSGFSGSYSVDLSGYDKDGNISTSNYVGSNNRFNLGFSPLPGSKIIVKQIVSVDIKPGTNLNPLNLKSEGVIPIAILTTPNFDARTVDPLSVLFGPNGAKDDKGHYEDVNSDGNVDLVFHFKTQDTGIKVTDTQACLSGATFTGFLISGCDQIRIVPSQ